MTTLLGVIGWPIAHSRSPAMHQAAIDAAGLDARYLPMSVRPEALSEAIAGLAALGFRGVNVTLPHKERVLPLLDSVDDAARAIGAVNTIVFEAGESRGLNTDAPGLVAALGEAGVELAGAEVVVLGAGGAARAAVVGLAQAGASGVSVAARRREQAEALADELGGASCRLRASSLDGLESLFAGADLVIQATSATLGGGRDAELFANALPLSALPAHATVMDMVYEPRRTTVLEHASARGLRTVGGLGMLLHQGALAFERFLNHPADRDAMMRALGGT